MGIYSNDCIYGIRIYKFDDDKIANIIFEKTYNEVMNDAEKKEAYLYYIKLNTTNEIRFQYYLECSSTYSNLKFHMWCPISLDLFLERFDV